MNPEMKPFPSELHNLINRYADLDSRLRTIRSKHSECKRLISHHKKVTVFGVALDLTHPVMESAINEVMQLDEDLLIAELEIVQSKLLELMNDNSTEV